MKKTSAAKPGGSRPSKDLRNEYRFDYLNARPNRFCTSGAGEVSRSRACPRCCESVQDRRVGKRRVAGNPESGPATKIDGDFEWREIALAAQGVRFVAEELSAPCI
jgi:hypothetical protein